MKSFKGKKVVIMGLGLHGGGASAAVFFAKHGARVLVTDLKTEEQLKDSMYKLEGLEIEYALGGHRTKDFIDADLIIKNPDVSNNSPYLKVAKENNVEIETDIGIFMDLAKGMIIGVTGTKGKSTTATLIYQMLKSEYPNTLLGGNIGVSALDLLDKISKNTKIVLELSSFELENLKKSPHIAVITNIMPDHLNRYKDMDEYIEAKKLIFKYQKKNDILVLNQDDLVVRDFALSAPSKVHFFSSSNFSAAQTVARILKVPDIKIEKVIKDFKGIPFRQELIAEINGVYYYNDTTATMPDAVCMALRTFSYSPIVLIAGGQDKNLDYKDMAKEINKRVKHLVLLPGTASIKLKKELKIPTTEVKSMEEGVVEASKLAKPGDIVLLSPGAASFNLFKNEFDRGEQFNKFVNDREKTTH